MKLKESQAGPSLAAFDLGLPPFLSGLVRWLLGLNQLEAIYFTACRNLKEGAGVGDFCQSALNALGVKVEFPLESLESLRAVQGPVLFVANHPFGGVDALVLISMLQKIRPEFKLLGNSSLKMLPELKSVLVPVNVMESSRDSHSNVKALRSAMEHLLTGGALGIFPAGEVAELQRWSASVAEELPWTLHVGILAKRTRATVVPVYFHGQASTFFLRMGYLFPFLRLPLLVRELLKPPPVIRVQIGAPLGSKSLMPEAFKVRRTSSVAE
jgi:putative hemolysin